MFYSQYDLPAEYNIDSGRMYVCLYVCMYIVQPCLYLVMAMLLHI